MIVGTTKDGSITSGYSGADVKPYSLIGALHVVANQIDREQIEREES